MKSLTVSIAERLVVISVANNPENKVPTSDLKVYLEDLNKFRLTEEEKVVAEWVEEKNPEGQLISYKWNPNAPEKTLEIEEFTRKYLEEKVKALEVSAADPLANPIITLLEKLC